MSKQDPEIDHDTADGLRKILARVTSAPPPDLARGVWDRIEGVSGRHSRRSRLSLVAAGLVTVVAVAAVGVSGHTLRRGTNAVAGSSTTNNASPGDHTARAPVMVLAGAHLGLTCQLPVVVGGDGPGRKAGLLNVADGRFTESTLPDEIRRSSGSPRYIASLHEWVDVLPNLVAPDGSYFLRVDRQREHLAANGGSIATIVRIDASGPRIVWQGDGLDTVQGIAGIASSGIIIRRVFPSASSQVTTWIVDQKSGAVRQLPNGFDSLYVSGNSLWQYTGSTRTDLNTLTVEHWFDPTEYLGPYPAPKVSPEGATADARFKASLIAFTAEGTPIVRFGSRDPGTPYSLIALVKPGVWTVLVRSVAGTADAFDSDGGVTDGNGVWFGDMTGANVWHYAASTGLQKTATVTGANRSVRVAGPCI